MGHAVLSAVSEEPKTTVIAGVDVSPDTSFVPLYHGIDEVAKDIGADVIVDFSHHTAIEGILNYAKEAGCAVIICTTGHTDEELKLITEASKEIPVFRSGNMSLGINLLTALVRKAASVLDGFDIEIIEKHHNQKLDAPSGTAIMLANSAAEGTSYTPEYVYDRHTVRRKRGNNEIGIHSVRGGSIVGEHEVLFAGTNETVTLSHSAASREVFAVGAVHAAIFMKGKAAGLYSMKDVIDSMIGG